MERSGAIMSCIIVARNYNSYMSVNFFSRYATYSSGRKGPQIRELRLDHIIQQRFNLCHMLFLLSKIRIGSIIADVIRAYPAFDVSCGRRAVVLYS